MDDNKGKSTVCSASTNRKQFGKGSIMKMGDAEIDEVCSQYQPAHLALISRLVSAACLAAELLKFMVQSPQAKLRYVCKLSLKCKSLAVSLPSSMPNTPSIHSTHKTWRKRQ